MADQPLNRRQLRIKVLQALYALLSSGSSNEEVFDHLLAAEYKEIKQLAKRAAADKKENLSEKHEDEAAFLRDLFMGAAQRKAEYEALIGTSLQNWDISRVALVDRVILLLGIHELLNFQHIPVKVTLNEYLDIAKEYSTEKSSQFVNGILDSVLQHLQKDNLVIKKGRGLLENGPTRRKETKTIQSTITTTPSSTPL